MNKPEQIIEIFLQPGDFYFGGADTRIRTLLGSCVSITLWHPRLSIGGMCHYMLPSRGQKRTGLLDGRYADEALELFMRELCATKTRPAEYEVKLFGGGNMFSHLLKIGESNKDVPYRNVEAARVLTKQYGFRIKAEHLAGKGHRQVIFDIWNGHVWMKHHEQH